MPNFELMKATIESELIVGCREKHGWTQQEQADQAGIPLEDLQLIESGTDVSLRNKSLHKLAALIEKNCSDLVTE